MTITRDDVFKAVSDLISESYDWLSDDRNKDKSVQYILGLNDMARYLAEMIDGAEDVVNEK